MKKNKGFTLIELLAVIVILAIIGLIAIPTAIDSINNSKEKLYREQVKRVLSAADSWASSNDNKLPSNDGETIIVTIDELQSAGLLKKGDVKNPLNGKENMSQEIVIYYDSHYNQYVSGYCDDKYWDKYYNAEEYETIKNKCTGDYSNQNDKILLGDINGDGVIDQQDVTLLGRLYMSDSKDIDMVVADINGDGVINNTDIIMLGRMIPSSRLLGDINGDGVIDQQDVTLLGRLYMSDSKDIDMVVADINGDGVINNTDIIMLGRMIPSSRLLGDINGDGVIDQQDVTLLGRLYMSDSKDIDMVVADINGDGVINNTDIIMLGRMIP